ncbi:MAG: ceramidase domain-containing protein [Deltaproteobacteria bacterium]|nr:ceramidase domain-containing protein [Deltaproteobacteria bacterium]
MNEAMHCPAGSPWSGYAAATMKYCEANLCGWIAQPANTFSNLGIVIVGIWLAVLSSRRTDARPLKLIGPIAIALGITSLAYHASYTFFWQFFDLSSMFLFSTLLLVLNLQRLGALSQRAIVPTYVILNVVSMALLWAIKGKIGMVIFGLQLLAAVAVEVMVSRVAVTRVNYKDLWRTLVTFLAAYTFWILDYTGAVCNPGNHVLQGHAAWHLVNSFCFIFMYRFYRQFDWEKINAPQGVQESLV